MDWELLRSHNVNPEKVRRLDDPWVDMVQKREAAWRAARGRSKRYRTAVCHTCGDDLDSRFDSICPRCGWIECPQCGGCGCN